MSQESTNALKNALKQLMKQEKQQSPSQKAQFHKNQFQKDLSYMKFMFARQVCWWFMPKNIALEKELIKKICSQYYLFLKLFKCKLAHGSILYLIIIDGYAQNKGENCIKGIQKALKLLKPVVPIQGFKLQEILNYNFFEDGDLQCMICLDVKSLGNKQNCCGKPVCTNCRKNQKQNCFYCKQALILRDYVNQGEYKILQKMIKDYENDISKNGVLV